MTEVPTYTVLLKMAGDIDHAKQILRDECYHEGLCVTIDPTTFIYTGGEESGFVVGFVNYPRFPSAPVQLLARAVQIAEKLISALNQKTALLIAPDKTQWVKIDPPGVRA